MKILLRLLSVLLIIISCSWQGKASHIAGGDITWECLGDGSYRFKLVVYRDCAGIGLQQGAYYLQVHNHPTVDTIRMHLVDNYNVSHLCNFGTPVACSTATASTVGALEVYVFKSNPIFLGGTPPVEGWVFTHHNCCRNNSIVNIIGAGYEGSTYRAKMFGNSQGNPCNDSSPEFADAPFFMGCASTPMIAYNYATDADGDSLVYDWASTLDAIDNQPFVEGSWPAALLMDTGYTFNSPFPDTSFDPNNVPANLDPNTGIMTFTSYNLGTYAYVVKVSSFRDGELISEVYREMQATIVPCNEIGPEMEVRPPFYNTNTQTFLYDDTITAGDLVNFDIVADALGNLSNGNAPVVMLQASGTQFGNNYTNPNAGCPYPPCATLSPAPPAPDTSLTAPNFNWQTDVSHLLLGPGTIQTYDFVFKGNNGICPLPRYDQKTVRITLVPPPQFLALNAPSLQCVQVQSVTGNDGTVTLNWNALQDPNSIFTSYEIYHSHTYDGGYTLLTSISDINQTSYSYTEGVNQNNFYYIKTKFAYNTGQLQSYQSDILRAGYLNLSSKFGVLNWNNGALNFGGCNYEVWRKLPDEAWQIIDHTTESYYIDTMINGYVACGDTVGYKIVCEGGPCSQETNTIWDVFNDSIYSNINITNQYVNNFQIGLIQFGSSFNVQGQSCVWDFGDGTTSNECAPIHQYTANGSYNVQLIKYTPCNTDTFYKIVDVVVDGINEAEDKFSFELYPNPTKGELFVKFKLTQEGAVELRVLDILGREEQVIPAMRGYKEMSLGIDVSNLPAGIHLLEMLVNGQRSVAKFIKE